MTVHWRMFYTHITNQNTHIYKYVRSFIIIIIIIIIRQRVSVTWVTETRWRRINTGRFIMFSVITNIYNKKTKGPTLMELFTATGKLKKFFFYN